MYATISDLLRDLLGIQIPLPIQTFGFLMALSFIGAYWATSSELKRLELVGFLKTVRVKKKFNEPITLVDYSTSVIITAFLGFKLLEMVLDYDALVENPQRFLLSAKGSWFGALAGGVYGYWMRKKESDALEGKVPEIREVTVHPYQLMGTIVSIAAIGGILGAKIFHNLENLDELMADPIGSLISFSGLTFYGGLIVAATGILIYVNKHGIPAWRMCDAAAPGLLLAYGIGRLGCHLSGDGDWGIDNLIPKPEWMAFLPDWTWGFRYPHNVLGEGIPIPGCEGNHCAQLANPVFPTAFYEFVVNILLFAVLWMIRKRVKIAGNLFLIYLIMNGAERFLIEKIRVNTTYSIMGHAITQAEIISFTLLIVGSSLLIYRSWKAKTTVA